MIDPIRELTQQDHIALVERARRVAKDVSTDACYYEEREEFPQRSWEKLKASGLLSLTSPSKWGGQAKGTWEACLVLEELAAGCFATAMLAQAAINGGPKAIEKLGTDEQRSKYLPLSAKGDCIFAVAMTERSSGSSAFQMETEIESREDGFFLSGSKCYITLASSASHFLVFARLSGTQRTKGIGAVILERGQSGLHVSEAQPKMGQRAISECELSFKNVEVRQGDFVIHPDPHSKGAALLMIRQFNPERCGNAAISVGLARAALEASIERLQTRKVGGVPISSFQGLRWKLADMASQLDAARLMVWRAAKSDEGGFPVTRLTAMAKLYANEAARRVCDEAIQIHGHEGYTRTISLERIYRDVRGLSLSGGTTEVMRNLVARELIG